MGQLLNRHFTLVKFLIFLGFAVLVSVIITITTPRLYKATTKVEIALPSFITTQGSSINNGPKDLSTYIALIDDQQFKKKVVDLLLNESKHRYPAAVIRSINISASIVPDTHILAINVEANSPYVAMIAANASAQILIRDEENRWSSSDKNWINDIRKTKISSLEDKMRVLRTELQNLKSNGAGENQDTLSAKIANIQDQIDDVKFARNMYNDFLAKIELSQIVNKNNISVLYEATLPNKPFKPNFALNIAIAILASAIVGLTVVFLRTYPGFKENGS